MTADLTLEAQSRCFGGWVAYYSHLSQCCRAPMRFSVFVPPQAQFDRVPVLYYLSGLTCTPENFTLKAGAQRYAAELGIVLVAPDTSPRHTGIPGEERDWDLGSGAGFYVDATADPWQQHYQMYSYVVEELPQVIAAHFPVKTDRQGIFGHSMGGHGALVCALRNGDRYRSVSALAAIAAPMGTAWGEKAFGAYLGNDREKWRDYDASQLVKRYRFNGTILLDQGTEDEFYQQQRLQPEVFEQACQSVGQPVQLRLQPGYDHSYFMVATFMEDHIRHHAAVLCAG
ncbi:MAG: S-formylglutathione hydrolase [Chloroflexaceae bacterium]|nr:S-formylglutathione hydrolase [Chloroflexaceae bacterium]